MRSDPPVEIGVITGVGQSGALRDLPTVVINTPYGPTSEQIRIGRVGQRAFALLARRGDGERLQPHQVPSRANVWALAKLGVRSLISSTASSGLNDAFAPGMFVIPDQLLDLTSGREATFFDDGDAVQLPMDDPFDPTLRELTAEALATQNVRLRDFGTAAVINGPRFSTLAESRWLAAAGADMVNKALMPEVGLARELGMAVVNVSFITSRGDISNRDHRNDSDVEVLRRRVGQAQGTLSGALITLVRSIPRSFHGVNLAPLDRSAEVLARIAAVGS